VKTDDGWTVYSMIREEAYMHILYLSLRGRQESIGPGGFVASGGGPTSDDDDDPWK
jgi:hypothetical protein